MTRRNIYSHYLPLKRHARTASRSASINKETARSPTKEKETRNGRASSANQTSKRRSTLNSREAGYDEAEALRRAIEASKEDALPEPNESGNRRPKRGRSDSQEYATPSLYTLADADLLLRKPENTKRQRTDSRSVSPTSPDKNAEDSDDAGVGGRNGASKSKTRNGGTTRSQRTEKVSEKEERERQRAETANKRKVRADRRRAEGMASSVLVKVSGAHPDTDSDPSEEMPLAARVSAHKPAPTSGGTTAANAPTSEPGKPPAVVEPPPAPQPAPDTPPTIMVQTKADKKRSHKKKGRNQYTRDRDARDEESPARSQSRDIQKDEHGPTSTGKASGEGGGKGNARSRGGMNSKITMNDMKRRATALLDFISRTQVELAGESFLTPSEGSGNANGTSATASEKAQDEIVEPRALAPEQNGVGGPEKEFKELGCMEMMDSLTRRLVKWQQQYAV